MPTAWNCICVRYESSSRISISSICSPTVKSNKIKCFASFLSYKIQTSFIIFCICDSCEEYSDINIYNRVFVAFYKPLSIINH